MENGNHKESKHQRSGLTGLSGDLNRLVGILQTAFRIAYDHMLQAPGAFNSGKSLANVSKNVMLTPVGGLGDDAYCLAVSDQVGLVVKKGGLAFKVAVYPHGPLGRKQTAERTLVGKIAPRL